MANQFYSEHPERKAAAGGAAKPGPDPIPRGSATPGAGKTGTYTHPKGGTARAVRTKPGPRVKTSMRENY